MNTAREQLIQAKQNGVWDIGTLTTITNDVSIDDGGNVISVDDAGGSLTVDGTVTANVTGFVTDTDDDSIANAQTVQLTIPLLYAYDDVGGSWERLQTDGSGALDVKPTGGIIDTLTTITNDVSIDDGGNSITVDNSVLSVVGGGTEATAQRVTIANDSTGVITVDGTVAVTGFNTDTDDDVIAVGQTSQLVISQLYGWDDGPNEWNRVEIDGSNNLKVRVSDGTTESNVNGNTLAASIDEADNALNVVAGCFGYYAAGGGGALGRPLLMDLEDNAIANGQIAQVNIPLNYSYDSAGGVWERTLADGSGNQYAHLTDATDTLDIVNDGDALDTGIVSYGYDEGNTTVHPIPIADHAFAANWNKHIPVGGIAYPLPGAAYIFKTDNGGYQYAKVSDGTDVLDVVTTGAVPSNGIMAFALNTSNAPDDAQAIVIHEDGVATARDFNLPVGGTNYGAPDTPYTIKVDVNGSQFFELTGITNSNLISVSENEALISLPVNAGVYGYYAAGGGGALARPLLMDLDDGALLAGNILQTTIGKQYGWNAGAAGWVRQPGMEGVTNPGYQAISDGLQLLDVTVAGAVVGTGLTAFGELGTLGIAAAIPVVATGAAIGPNILPTGGEDYSTGSAQSFDIDSLGRISVRDLGTNRDGVAEAPSTDVTSRAIHTSEVHKDIWSDSFELFKDTCETESGAGLTTCKWLPASDFAPHDVTSAFRRYVEGDIFLGTKEYPYVIPPKEGNWMLKLYNTGEEYEIVESDCYTKLGFIGNKKIALDFWFSLKRHTVEAPGAYTTIEFGFHQFFPNQILTQYYANRFLVRYRFLGGAGDPEWQYYNAAGTWTTIDTDVRTIDSVDNFPLTFDSWCWHKAKLVVDCTWGTPAYKSLTIDDTTWDLGSAGCKVDNIGVGLATPRAALCPYFYMQAPCEQDTWDGETEYIGSVLLDDIHIYTNELEDYNGDPTNYGQSNTGVG
jgi:hypothetical protein